MKRSAFPCLLILPLLTACGPMQIRDAQTGLWTPMAGGTLELHRDIRIPAGRARVFFQDGAPSSGINEFRPFCQIEISTLREAAQTVRPDTFQVTPVGAKFEEIVERVPVQLASLFIGIGDSVSGDGGPTRVSRVLSFRLHSDAQPDVRSLACGGAFDEPRDAHAPTLQEIAAAFGDYATLNPR